MPKFKIYAGLGGGFGGLKLVGAYEYNNHEEAMEDARIIAIEEYQMYEGYHGLRDLEQIIEEDFEGMSEEEIGEEELEHAYMEEMESWIDYDAEEVDDNYEYSEDDE